MQEGAEEGEEVGKGGGEPTLARNSNAASRVPHPRCLGSHQF